MSRSLKRHKAWRCVLSVVIFGWVGTVLGADEWSQFALPAPGDFDAEVNRLLPEIEHVPFEKAGFNLMSLPLRYEDPDGVGDRSEADALAFLLSEGMDWANGNYCARHSYFVFERSGEALRALSKGYDGKKIGLFINQWRATHAVGGLLRRTKAGCSGTLEIYDSNGTKVYEKKYDQPRDYVELLGDMTVDGMTYFGDPPSPDLAKLLHEKRCDHLESIVRLGLAAYLPIKDELPILEQIVKEDPKFVEVRSYWASRNGWTLGNFTQAERERSLCLRERTIPSALDQFDIPECRDPESLKLYPAQVAAAEKLVASDSTVILQAQLECDQYLTGYHPEHVKQGLKAAAQFPNSYNFVDALVRAMSQSRDGPVDAETAARLAVIAERDLYMPGIGDKRSADENLLICLRLLGRPDLAAQAIARAHDHFSYWLPKWCEALCGAGRFAEALDQFKTWGPVPDDVLGRRAATQAVVAAAMTRDDVSLRELQAAWSGAFGSEGVREMLDCLHDARAGTFGADDRALVIFKKYISSRQSVALATLGGEAELEAGKDALGPTVREKSAADPNNRILWKLADGYERSKPSEWGVAFYDALDWVHGDDPWVKHAVSDWKARRDHVVLTKLKFSLSFPFPAVLSMYQPETEPKFNKGWEDYALMKISTSATPFLIAHMVRDMLTQGKQAEAKELALRFQNVAVQSASREERAWAGWIVRRTN